MYIVKYNAGQWYMNNAYELKTFKVLYKQFANHMLSKCASCVHKEFIKLKQK